MARNQAPAQLAVWREIRSLAFLLVTGILFLSVFSHGQALREGDLLAPNICGTVGSFIGELSIRHLGLLPSYLLLIVVGAWAASYFFRLALVAWPWKLVGALLLAIGLGVVEWQWYRDPIFAQGANVYPAGGVFGHFLGSHLQQAFNTLGTSLIAGFCVLVGGILATEMLISPLLRRALLKGGEAAVDAGRKVPTLFEMVRQLLPSFTRSASRGTTGKQAGKAPAAAKAGSGSAKKASEKAGSSAATSRAARKPAPVAEVEEEDEEEPEDEEWEEEEWEEEEEEDEEEDDEEEEYEEEENEEPAAAKPPPVRNIRLTSIEEKPFEIDETQLTLQGCYNLPSISLLADPTPISHADGREELEQVAVKIEQTLASFKIDATVGEIQRGPVITQYEVSLGPGIKVHKIASLADDLAMALSARSIRVVAPIPGKAAVGIEVPNTNRETVVLKELLLSRQYRESNQRIPLLLGKDADGTPLVQDLTKMPHLLLAGATGSGKSVCINTIICSMLMTRTPDELKLILVDPKMVELSIYEDIPHLLTPVITDMKKAPAALEWLVRKMDQRYDLLSKAEVRHIDDYNALDEQERYQRLTSRLSHEEADQAPKHLPYIVIIIDELADLMMTNGKDVETSVVRLSQKSRAVGIHVVLATQRPSVDVITGLIKSNLPCRISFKVASRVDSRTILDRIGSERLLGQGDFLIIPPGTSTPERAQCTYISDREIKRVVRFLKKEARPQFSREIEGYLDGGVTSDASEPVNDDMFDQAVRIVLESQRGSASLLQRRLGIGYTRASRLMDIMAEQGIVGTFKGSKAREVMMTIEDWDAQSG